MASSKPTQAKRIVKGMSGRSAVAYIRRSDSKQEESLSIQREIIQRYAADNGYRIAQWFEDDGISGDDESRPGFVSMIEAAEQGEFEFILVRNLSRFCRFRMTTATRYIDILDLAGVHVVSTEEGEIDPENLASVLITNINSHSNKKYLTDLSSNTIAGQAKSVKQGRIAGQRAPFGFDRMYVDPEGNHRQRVKQGEQFAKPKSWQTILVPSDNHEEIELVREIFTLYFETTKGSSGIAAELTHRGIPAPKGGAWNKGTIGAMLRNPAYVGDYVWNRRREGKHHSLANGEATPRDKCEFKRGRKAKGRRAGRSVFQNDKRDWIIHFDAHEAIVPRDLFDRAQEKLTRGATALRESATSRRGVRTKAGSYALSGLVRCADCEGKMHGTRYTRKKGDKVYKYRSYVCSTYASTGGAQCFHNKADASGIERCVVQAIVDVFRDPELRAELREAIVQELAEKDVSPALDQMRTELASRDKEIETAGDRLLRVPEELFETLATQLAKMKQARDDLAAEVEHTERAQTDVVNTDPDRVLERLDDLADQFEQADGETLQQLFEEFVDRVELDFEPRQHKSRRYRVCVGGRVHLNSCQVSGMAGTGFEPATSRL